MKTFDYHWLKPSVAQYLKNRALSGIFDGRGSVARLSYLDSCKGLHLASGSVLLFTRDHGHHTSGWWKNPDYERCWHLSLSFVDPCNIRQRAPRDTKLTREWVGLFFGDDAKKLWCEPPYSREGKAYEVWHYRLFCAPNWTPILPRVEVYSRELTEAGWKSYSDVESEIEEITRKAAEHAQG